jgi:Tfp pilus assembly protein PilX
MTPAAANQRGSALIFAMGFMVVVLVIATGTHNLVLSQLQSSGALRRRVTAEYLAQAGVARTIGWFNTQNYQLPQASSLTATVPAKLTSNSTAVVLPSNHPTSYTDALGTSKSNVVASYNSFVTAQGTSAGTFSVVASLLDSAPETWEIVATGLSGTVQRQVGALLVRPQNSSQFTSGLFGLTGVTLSGTGSIDSYDASVGAYGGANILKNGTVVSNGNVTLSGSAIVKGDAVPGPGKAVNLSGTASVTGATTPAASARTLPALTIPAGAVNLGAINLSGIATQTLTAGTYKASSMSITNSGKLIIDASGGAVNLFVTGAISAAGAGIVNGSGLPKNFSLAQIGGANVTISNSSDFFGTVYAPDSALSMPGDSVLYGGFIGKSINVPNSSRIHFDQSLRTLPGGSGGPLKLVAKWTLPS